MEQPNLGGALTVDLRQIRARVNNVARDARNLSRCVETEAFARAWETASPEQREELQNYILGIDKDKVDRWVKRVLAAVNLQDKSIREIRDLARAAGIPYVHDKQKDDLIQELRKL